MGDYSASTQFPAPVYVPGKKSAKPWTSRARTGAAGATGTGSGSGTSPSTPSVPVKTSGQLWPRS